MTAFQLFDALDPATEAALRASIERFGVLVPVAVDQDGNILDGHHRRRIAAEVGALCPTITHHCLDDGERREIARTLNMDRRQLDVDQRREVVAALREQGHSLRSIAGAVGVSLGTVQRDVAGVSPDTPDEVRGADGKSYPARREVTDPDAQALADDLAAHDATFAAIAQNFDRQDDEPALTQAECEALADPRDLDDPEPMPSEDAIVDALERRSPGVKADLARVDLRAKYSRSLTGVTGLFVLGPELVAAVLSDTEVGVLEGTGRELSRWISKVVAVKRRTGLTVVNGGKQ